MLVYLGSKIKVRCRTLCPLNHCVCDTQQAYPGLYFNIKNDDAVLQLLSKHNYSKNSQQKIQIEIRIGG